MAIFEIKTDLYYHGLWRADTPNGDLMALMWKEDGHWVFRYRIRVYKDEKAFESIDERTVREVRAADGPGVRERLFTFAHGVLNSLCELGLVVNLTYYPCHGNGTAMITVLQSVEGVHMKVLSKEEYEAYVKTNTLPQ